uniref:Uncharacterized protein n=1 Tax=Avena sativa TaxID=4498 RepID=A0ACD5WXG3_AVESA
MIITQPAIAAIERQLMEWLTILFCVTLSLPLIIMLSRHGGKKLPPGPPSLFFIAKFLLPWRRVPDIGPMLHGLHARYGPIISIWLFRTFIFVADHQLAHSFLVKGGGNFDDRPPPNAVMQLFFPRGIGPSPYGAYWRLVRRNLSMQVLHPSRIRLFAPARQRAYDAMVATLRGNDSDVITVRPFLERCLFELIVEMSIGARLSQEVLDELKDMHREIFLALAEFPIFSIFPALTMRKRWARYIALWERRSEVLLPLIHAPRGAGDTPCYADSLLELRVADEGGRPLTDDEMVSLCSEFMLVTMDSSVSMMEWIMAELVSHPDAQAKVYKEVMGKTDVSDGENDLPYLRAVVLESLRLHPGAHLIPPHGVQSDAEVGGYMVPKGAVINFFVADLGREETMWTTAREFQPERFLDGGADMDLDITGRREIKMAPFGAGRRMCPGYMVAMQHAESLVGTLVREFQWLPPAQAQDSNDVDMTEEEASFIAMKHSLRARIIPRT